jgi:hypothetical protein
MWHSWERNVCKVLMGKQEGKRLLGRPRRRWEDGIRIVVLMEEEPIRE